MAVEIPRASDIFCHPVSGMGLTILRGIRGDAWTSAENLWALGFSAKLVGVLFPSAHSVFAPRTLFNLGFVLRMATSTKEESSDPSQLFWYID